jgi:integral membrane protein
VSSTTQTSVKGAFVRFRVMAFVTGSLFLILVFVAVPLKYLGDHPGPAAVFGTAHGFLFIVYLVTALDLGVRLQWPWRKLGLRMLAGTVPFAAFVVERRAHAEVNSLAG